MPRLSSPPVNLSEDQIRELQAVVRKHTSPQRSVTRAKIILFAAENKGIRETCRILGVSRSMVQKWRRRWLESPEGMNSDERLKDVPRPGVPAVYTPEQICSIIAIACERPEDSCRPVTHWTQQELADEAVKRGVVGTVSQRSVGRFLNEVDLKPHRVRGWLTPKHEEGFKEKCHDVCETYELAQKREKEKKKLYPLMK
ncbi:MAG: helix-turn-helix domain-containing protein [Gammaproteobacteria bacterium]|nr:helix-turn-helix domain-containing protein [Gammaproteobacteria bacterium]